MNRYDSKIGPGGRTPARTIGSGELRAQDPGRAGLRGRCGVFRRVDRHDPLRRAMNEPGRRVSLHQRDEDQSAARGFNFGPADDLLGAVIAPFTRTSGRIRSISSSGVSSAKTVTASTHSSAAKSSARASSLLRGREGPLSRRTLSSEFKPTTRKSPRAAACLKSRTWPTCNTSKQPLVNTT